MKNHRKLFERTVASKARRKRRARQQRQSVWFGLGMFGLVGWSVALPTLIGIAVGVWLDTRSDTREISWTLTGLAVGISVGCVLTWLWIRQESRPEPDSWDDSEIDGNNQHDGENEEVQRDDELTS